MTALVPPPRPEEHGSRVLWPVERPNSGGTLNTRHHFVDWFMRAPNGGTVYRSKGES